MDVIKALRNKFKFDKESPWHFYRKVLLWSFIVASCITVPFVIYEWINTGSPVFLYFGDYNVQQICFYEHAIDMVQSGDFGWDWVTDLGSNFVGSYSYYMLGSPFFWIMCLFPSTWAPYLMAPMYIVKYMVAAVLAYAYIQRFVKNKNYAVIGALLYSFSGFQIYNTFFNQFHDVVAFFPLLLIGIEEYVQNDRRGLFAIAVTINALINYFMFAGQVVFCVIYFMARIFCGSFKINLKKMGGLVFEAVIGFVMAWFLFIPAASALMGNSRIENSYTGYFNEYFKLKAEGKDLEATKKIRGLFFWKSNGRLYWERYGHIFESYFFPPDIPSRVNFFDGHGTRWASISMYLPMFSMSGVFAFFTVKKRTWLKSLIAILIVSSFIPLLNSAFFLFNSSYYARWLYMMILMFSLATAIALEDTRTTWKIPTALMTFFCTAVTVSLGLIWHENKTPTEMIDYTSNANPKWWEVMELGYPPYRIKFWIYVAIAFLGIALTAFIIRRFRGTKVFEKAVLYGVVGMTILYSCVHITNGKEFGDDSHLMVDYAIEGNIDFPDTHDEFYRIDEYRYEKNGSHDKDKNGVTNLDNLGIFWNMPTIENFHTVVPPSIMEFYPKIGVKRSVSTRAVSDLYGLRAFMSVKYSVTVMSKYTWDNRSVESNGNKFITVTPHHDTYGFKPVEWDSGYVHNGFAVYENENFIPMGFAYTEFMTESDFEAFYTAESSRHAVLCKYLIVPDDKAEYYAQFMTQVKEGELADETTFKKSVEERKQMCASDFNYSGTGFDATIDLKDGPNVVYFSVPYEAGGWTAKVNGEEAEVLKVTYGFVAVECEEGENFIEFEYRTPGFITPCELTVSEKSLKIPGGLWFSIGAVVIYIGYMLYLFLVKKHKPRCAFFSFDDFDDCGGDMPIPEPLVSEKAVMKKAVKENPTKIDITSVLSSDEAVETQFEETEKADAAEEIEASEAVEATEISETAETVKKAEDTVKKTPNKQGKKKKGKK